jgi:hypothetical protein
MSSPNGSIEEENMVSPPVPHFGVMFDIIASF